MAVWSRPERITGPSDLRRFRHRVARPRRRHRLPINWRPAAQVYGDSMFMRRGITSDLKTAVRIRRRDSLSCGRFFQPGRHASNGRRRSPWRVACSRCSRAAACSIVTAPAENLQSDGSPPAQNRRHRERGVRHHRHYQQGASSRERWPSSCLPLGGIRLSTSNGATCVAGSMKNCNVEELAALVVHPRPPAIALPMSSPGTATSCCDFVFDGVLHRGGALLGISGAKSRTVGRRSAARARYGRTVKSGSASSTTSPVLRTSCASRPRPGGCPPLPARRQGRATTRHARP